VRLLELAEADCVCAVTRTCGGAVRRARVPAGLLVLGACSLGQRSARGRLHALGAH
jgi:hypothetical protein